MARNSEQEPLLPGQDEANVSGDSHVKDSRLETVVLIVIIFGVFLSMACESFVTATHGEIASSFNNLWMGPWLLTAYGMGYSMMLPLYGNLTEKYGCKKLLLLAYGAFSVGCIMTGCATSMPMAIVGRFITGTGGAGMMDLVSIILCKMTSPSEVGPLRGYLSLGITLGVSCGPPLGGVLTDTVGWRWSFLCLVPAALICAAVTTKKLPSDSPRRSKDDHPAMSFDFCGYILLFVALGCSMVALHLVGEMRTEDMPLIVVLSVICALSTVTFILVELYTKKHPVVCLRLMVKNGIGLICLGQICLVFCQYGLVSNFADFVIRTQNAQNSVVGLLSALRALGATIGALSFGYLLKWYKKCNALTNCALSVLVFSCSLITARWRIGVHNWEVIYIILPAMGISALYSTQFVALSVRLREASASIVTSYHLCQQIGTVLGTACTTGFARIAFRNRLVHHLGDSTTAQQIIEKVLQNNRFGTSLPTEVQMDIRTSFLESFPVVTMLCLGSSVLMLPLMLRLENILVT